MTEETTGPVKGDNAVVEKPASFFDADGVRASVTQAVDAWMAGHRNSRVSQDTGVWSQLYNSLPALVEQIVQEITK